MVTSSDGPEAVAAAQAAHGRERLAAGYEGIMAKLTEAAVARGLRAHRGGGGRDLGRRRGGLGQGRLRDRAGDRPRRPGDGDGGRARLALALKSGNFGGDDFLARALRVLEGKA